MLCIVQICLALLVIVAGMFLLATTQKDNLGGFFKAVAYSVLVLGFITFIASVGCALCGGACGPKDCDRPMNCSMQQSSCMQMDRNNCGGGGMMMMGGSCCRDGGMMKSCGPGGAGKCGGRKAKKCKMKWMDDDDMIEEEMEIKKTFEKGATPAEKK